MKLRLPSTLIVTLFLCLLLLAGCQSKAPDAPVAATASPTAPASGAPAASQTPAALASPVATPAAAATAALTQPLAYFVPQAGGQTDLRLADAAGNVLLASDRDGFATLAWSPDGRLGAAIISTGSERALMLFNVATKTALRTLTASAGGRLEFRAAANWSRLLVRREAELWSVALPAGTQRRLDAAEALAQWDVAGDGRWVLTGVEAEGHYVTALFDLQEGTGQEINSAPHPATEFSDDGRWLALVGQAAGETTTRLHVTDLGALPAETATRVIGMGSAIAPALRGSGDGLRYFTPDGSWLAYVVDSSGQRLRLRELAGQTRAEFPLQANERVGWLLVQPALRRGLLIAGRISDAGRNFRTHLLYPDQQISVPFLEGFSDAALLSQPQNPNVAIDARLADGQRYLALVDMVKGSGRIALRGRMRPLAVDPATERALVAINLGTMEDIHLLDLRNGGAITYMGRSMGGDARPALGQFAPAGHGVWTQLWRSDGSAGLALSAGAARLADVVAEKVTEPVFSPDGATLAFVRADASGPTVYIIRADGGGLRAIGAGRSPSWRAAP